LIPQFLAGVEFGVEFLCIKFMKFDMKSRGGEGEGDV